MVGLDYDDYHLLIVADYAHAGLLGVDVQSGHLYRIDLPNGRAHRLQLSGKVGNPTAIALSPDGDTLYSADEKTIKRISIDTTPAQVSTFSLFPSLQSPHSLSSLV